MHKERTSGPPGAAAFYAIRMRVCLSPASPSLCCVSDVLTRCLLPVGCLLVHLPSFFFFFCSHFSFRFFNSPGFVRSIGNTWTKGGMLEASVALFLPVLDQIPQETSHKHSCHLSRGPPNWRTLGAWQPHDSRSEVQCKALAYAVTVS